MDPIKKPEWFELVEKDGGLPRRTAKRGFRAVALSIPLMAIGIGVVLAQTSNEAPAIAETTSVAPPQSPLATTPPIAPNIATSKIANPAITTPPTGGGDDENENENEGEDD
jgi:hypothetical protein